MLFISGIHGVGKSYFCQQVKDKLGVISYSASTLISEKKNSGFSIDKLIPDIDDNQKYLLAAIDELNSVSKRYLLDGHFCLLNAAGAVQRIPQSTFTTLNPDAILLLTENAEVIADRRFKRDHIQQAVNEIEAFQREEAQYASEIVGHLHIPIHISPGAARLSEAIMFVGTTMGRI